MYFKLKKLSNYSLSLPPLFFPPMSSETALDKTLMIHPMKENDLIKKTQGR